jgi:HD-GYP domain-containing protein (c-di-GMP phosphodiesterase class II)
MLLGPNASHAREFENACASGDLDVDTARQGVGVLIHDQTPQAEQKAAILRWFCHDLVQVDEDRITLEEFSEQLAQAYEETNLMYRLARVMNVTSDPVQSIAMVSGQMHAIMPMAWIAVCFRSDSPVAGLANQLMVAGRPPCVRSRFDDLIKRRMAEWSADNWTHLLMPGKDELADLVGAEVIAEPITHDGAAIGAILTGNKRGPDPDIGSAEMQFFDAAADFMSVFHENIARFEEQRAMFMGTLKGLTAAIDAKDRYTRGHSERVAWLATALARALDMDESQIDVVHVAGLVHDVGKIGVPEAVLCKPGRLTDEEFKLIKQHPATGYGILKDIPPLKQMLPGVRYHHERWDGRGYPDGLAGEDIPLLGRIMACADAFDAMSSTRAYRPALPRAKVLAEFERCAGSQFDPKLVERFVQLDFTEFDNMLQRHRAMDNSAAA